MSLTERAVEAYASIIKIKRRSRRKYFFAFTLFTSFVSLFLILATKNRWSIFLASSFSVDFGTSTYWIIALFLVTSLTFALYLYWQALSPDTISGISSIPDLDERRELSVEDGYLEKVAITEVDSLKDAYHVLRLRLLAESQRLKFVSNKNLTFGILFSTIAFGILIYFVFSYSNASASISDDYQFVVRWFVPRIAIIVLVQIVAFFFLKLYVSNEIDIKLNKNELTNIEARVIAFNMALLTDKKLAKSVIENLSLTERNFLLKKGEKTIGLDHSLPAIESLTAIEGLISKLKLGSAVAKKTNAK